ncbi:MAG TPA: ribulose-phosphate 3-epimerase [Clostridiales bacterium]|nr:ribulose-phosphate 3-epimerase [Clostridiales bacterium]
MRVSVSSMPAGENIVEYVKQIDNFADFLHCDVCDGHYNSTMCFSPDLAKAVNDISTIPLDVHLMTKNAQRYAEQYIKSGANIVTAQVESFRGEDEIWDYIKFVKQKALVGLSLEPETSIEKILPFIKHLDVVLVMSVKTGKSGQKFDESVFDKIKLLSDLRNKLHFKYKIEVDGGVNDIRASALKPLGVDIVVSGNYVFNAKDRKHAIENLR